MPVIATVTYPNEPDATFDMAYYKSTHMPLVHEHWDKYGLKSSHVYHFKQDLNTSTPPISVMATLIFDSIDQLKAATSSPEAKEVFDDVPRFSNKAPTLSVGDVALTLGGSS